MSLVSVNYLDAFKGDNAIEFTSTAEGLGRFIKFLEKVANCPVGSSLDLSDEPLFSLNLKLRIQVIELMSSSGMFRSGSSFEWKVTRQQIKDCCDLIEAVAAADYPCHHYLDADDSGDCVVIVSNGE